MKKLTTLLTTTMIALALMMTVPSAMAGNEKANSYGARALEICIAGDNFTFKNQGQCVAFGIKMLKWLDSV